MQIIPSAVLRHQGTSSLFEELFGLPHAAVAGSERAFWSLVRSGADLPATTLGRCELFGLSYALWKSHGRACLRALALRLEIRKLESGNSKTQIPPETPASSGSPADPPASPVNAHEHARKAFKTPTTFFKDPGGERSEPKTPTPWDQLRSACSAIGLPVVWLRNTRDSAKIAGDLYGWLGALEGYARSIEVDPPAVYRLLARELAPRRPRTTRDVVRVRAVLDGVLRSALRAMSPKTARRGAGGSEVARDAQRRGETPTGYSAPHRAPETSAGGISGVVRAKLGELARQLRTANPLAPA